MSVQKATAYEDASEHKSKYNMIQVPRARKVGEGLVSTARSSLISASSCAGILMSSKPDLVSERLT